MTREVELQIDHVQEVNEALAVVVVRCLRGPVRLGARFHQIRETTTSIDLEVTQILWLGRKVDELDPVHSALVTLHGAGTFLLASGSLANCWQTIQGTNPDS